MMHGGEDYPEEVPNFRLRHTLYIYFDAEDRSQPRHNQNVVAVAAIAPADLRGTNANVLDLINYRIEESLRKLYELAPFARIRCIRLAEDVNE